MSTDVSDLAIPGEEHISWVQKTTKTGTPYEVGFHKTSDSDESKSAGKDIQFEQQATSNPRSYSADFTVPVHWPVSEDGSHQPIAVTNVPDMRAYLLERCATSTSLSYKLTIFQGSHHLGGIPPYPLLGAYKYTFYTAAGDEMSVEGIPTYPLLRGFSIKHYSEAPAIVTIQRSISLN